MPQTSVPPPGAPAVIARLFHPSETALLHERSPMGRARPQWLPLLMLVWSIWIFLTPHYAGLPSLRWLPATLATYAVFLVLYWRAYFRDRGHLYALSLGMGALAFALTPMNPGAQGFLIYACAFLGFTLPARRAIVTMVAMHALYAAEWLWLGIPTIYLFSSTVVGLAVGLMNLSFARRMHADAALRLSHDEVRRLAALAERERIGRDLHDLLGHTLSLVALKSELAGKLLQRGDSPQAREAARREIDEVSRVAREALTEVRAAVTGIRAVGVAAELASAKLLLESDGIAFEAEIAPECLDAGVLPAAVEAPLALTLREAVTNIQRHARARSARAALAIEGEVAVLRVSDDGRGGADAPGNGLTGMRERLEAVDGRLLVESPRGGGTRIEARVPLHAPETASAPAVVAPAAIEAAAGAAPDAEAAA